MVYRAHVRNGKIELDEPVTLPEGATVELSVLDGSAGLRGQRTIEQVIDEIVADVPETAWENPPPDPANAVRSSALRRLG